MNYPEYDPELPGFICSGCSSVTPINFDDVGPLSRVAPICKFCRDEWDKSTEKELAVLKVEPKIEFAHNLTANDDLFQMIKDHREALGLAVVVDEKLQKIADEFVKKRIYEDRYQGQDWLNLKIIEGHFTATIALTWLQSGKPYNDIQDLFAREKSKELLLGNDLKVGLAGDDSGVFCFLSEGR